MKVLNLIWGFSPGGVGKCFLVYSRVNETESALNIKSVCINLDKETSDLEALKKVGATIITIKNRRDLSWLKKLKNSIDEFEPVVIFTHGFNGPVVAVALRWRYGLKLPLLCSFHGEYHPPSFNRRFLAPLYNAASQFIYRKYATAILGVADDNMQFLVKKGIKANKISIVHNGIPDITETNADRTAFPLNDKEVILGFIGRLDPVKGLKYLLLAIKKLSVFHNNFGLIIVGDGPLRKNLEIQVSAMGIGSLVYFAGYQSRINDWLSIMSIYIQPSLFENHSISILEAMRAGKAIIATSVGGNSESVTHKKEGLLVKIKSSDDLAEAIDLLINDCSKREQFGKAARKRYEEEFTEERMMRKVADWLLKFDNQ